MSRQSSSEQQPRRVKVTLACIVCRKKKVKCDGVQPSCSRCKNSGAPCEYSDRPRKRGPPKGYVEVIENRAHRIETLLGNKKMDPRYISSPPTAAIANPTAASSSCANEIQKLVADAVHTVEAKLSSIRAASLPGSQGSVCDSSPRETDEWCDMFFKHFNVLFPILSKPHFMHQMEHDQVDPMLRYAVYAVGCRYANTKEQSGKIWFDKCLDMLSSSSSHDSILTVQTLAITCWYAYLTGDLQKCYALQQKLAYAVQNANLMQESAGHIVDQEMSRRAFWVSAVIDRWLAVCTGHRFLTCEANTKQPHLEDSQLSAIDSRKLQPQSSKQQEDLSVESALQVAAFSEMIKLSNIVGQAHYAAAAAAADSSLETALTAWLLNLPPYLEYGKSTTDGSPPSPIARIFHILYYTVQILLHRDRHSDLFSSICTTAANTIVHISEQMLHDSQERYLHNVFGIALTLASSVHLRDARASRNTHNSLPAEINLGKSLRVLKDANCTVLLQVDFDRLLHRFLVNRCGIVIDGHHDNASSQHYQQQTPTCSVTSSIKRPCVVDDLERAVKRPSFDFSRWLPPEMIQESQTLSTPSPSHHHETPVSTGIQATAAATTTTTTTISSSSPTLCMADLLAEPCYWLQNEFQPSPPTTHSPSTTTTTTTGALTNSPEISTPAGSSYNSPLDMFPKDFENVYTFCAADLSNDFI